MSRWTRVTVLDLPGWRRGRARSSPSTVEGVGRAAAGWLEVLDRRDVVLVGHSSGSQSALHTAEIVPDRISGLVLAGPTLDPRARHAGVLLLRTLDTIAREELAELPAVLPWYLASGGPAWLRLGWSVMRDRPEELVARMTHPVLFLTGYRDRFAPPAWVRTLAALVDAPHELVPGAHNACFTAPSAAAALVHRQVRRWSDGDQPVQLGRTAPA
jgi:pimeloyl-ACP methyl ester carboxylesterase